MLHAPAWLTWLIALIPILLILGAVLYLFAEDDNPGGGTEHHSGDDSGEGEDEPPESSDADGPDDVLIAA